MDKSQKSQVIKLSLLASLLIITPLVTASLRPTYLYFVFNLLIIALGAEAGLLSFFSKPAADLDKKPQIPGHTPAAAAKPAVAALEYSSSTSMSTEKKIVGPDHDGTNYKPKVVEKWSSEKSVGPHGLKKVVPYKVKKCPSTTPSLFFIGGGDQADHQAEELVLDQVDDHDQEAEAVELVEQEEEVGDLSGQDQLFTKAETFIGNFYKQLKMQREDSWKRIHGFIRKPSYIEH